MITSLQNNKVKEVTKLHNKKYRKEYHLIFDKKMIEYALKSQMLKEIYYVGNLDLEFDNCFEVSVEVMQKMAKCNTDILAVVKNVKEELVLNDRLLVLDNLNDPSNVGMLIRSAYEFGFNTIILSLNTVDIYHEKCLEIIGDIIYDVNIYRDDLLVLLPKLKNEAYQILATGLSYNTKELEEVELNDKYAIILGNEGNGVREEIFKLSNDTIKIRMENIDSLNVAIAGSIVMYYYANKEFQKKLSL